MPLTDDQQLETWNVAITADTSDLEAKLATTSRLGQQFSNRLVTAFDDLAIKGKSVGDVFKSLALNISNLALKATLQPLTSGLASTFQSMISGAMPFAKGGVIASPISFPLAGGASKSAQTIRFMN